jgi:hypothetical protein
VTPRERVIAALEHRQPDAVPYHVTFTAPARDALARYYQDPNGSSDYRTFAQSRAESRRTAVRCHADSSAGGATPVLIRCRRILRTSGGSVMTVSTFMGEPQWLQRRASSS